ncbi:MAG: hypothetical protein UR12_C0003G0004 [candidate division TM6 bacterium GW2011_GWF2_30_66]|jgi:hypothetical protein|nr:MAG: hypothetical protein UR12_C0003G0004 [candidate division TM6 bacterium GW2011_GWF2_30_66]
MAGPIAHIMLALSILPKNLPDTAVREFILGSSFPDIRYISKNIKREDTHFKNITLEIVTQKIQEKSFFQAGVLFHSLVDELRDWYMNKKNVYKIMPHTENAVRAIKFLEDNILYEKIKNIDQVIQYFDTILDEEIFFCTNKSFDQELCKNNNNNPACDNNNYYACACSKSNLKNFYYKCHSCKNNIKNWHKLMKTYCEKKMDPQHRLVCYLLLKYPNLPKWIIQIIAFIAFWLKILPQNFLRTIEVINECEKNEKLLKIIDNFYDNFEDVYKNYQDQDAQKYLIVTTK